MINARSKHGDFADFKDELPQDQAGLERFTNNQYHNMHLFRSLRPFSYFDGPTLFLKSETSEQMTGKANGWEQYCKQLATVLIPNSTHLTMLNENELPYVCDTITSWCETKSLKSNANYI